MKDDHGHFRRRLEIGNEPVDVKVKFRFVPVTVLAHFEADGLQDRIMIT